MAASTSTNELMENVQTSEDLCQNISGYECQQMKNDCSVMREWPLSGGQVEQFLREGYLVVEDVLTDEELESAVHGFKETLWNVAGVDIGNLEETGNKLSQLSSTNGSGGVLDVFYPHWKLQLQTNPKLFSIISQLWHAMYCYFSDNNQQPYQCHPFSRDMDCTTGYVQIDRVGYRLPTKLAQQLGTSKKRPLQRSLTPHLDCCPETFYETDNKTMWRPIQCFVSLTDTESPNTGGLELVPQFHRKFHQWIIDRAPSQSNSSAGTNSKSLCFGEYTHLRPFEDQEVMKQIQHIPVKSKSMVLWDYRLPHANSYRNDSKIPRAVVYCSFLPNIPINRAYVEKTQLPNYQSRHAPNSKTTTLWIKNSNRTNNYQQHTSISGDMTTDSLLSNQKEEGKCEFSELGAKLMGLDPWP